MEQQKNNEISIELDAEMARGIYSNLAVITHSATEFIVDFVSLMPGAPKAPVVSRIILAPEHAKRLLSALQDNIQKFETANGLVELKHNGMPPFPMNFGGGTIQA